MCHSFGGNRQCFAAVSPRGLQTSRWCFPGPKGTVHTCFWRPVVQTFDQLDLTEQTKKGIADMGFTHMTEVQARTIPQLLVGRDVLGAAKTGAQRERELRGTWEAPAARHLQRCTPSTCCCRLSCIGNVAARSAGLGTCLHPSAPSHLQPCAPLPPARLRQDAGLPHPLRRAAVPRQVHATQRHRGHCDQPHARAGAAGRGCLLGGQAIKLVGWQEQRCPGPGMVSHMGCHAAHARSNGVHALGRHARRSTMWRGT